MLLLNYHVKASTVQQKIEHMSCQNAFSEERK